mmetsp:Transcript_7559/g.13450  ORF Transcript_7559/g.13450 Transcript_7559/m.13450 type:complete len:327 (+) Transcript_7559:143-1123(+)
MSLFGNQVFSVTRSMSAEDDCTYLESSNSVPGISFGSRRSREDMGDEDEWQKMKRRCPEWGRLVFKWDVHVEGRIHDPKLDVHGLHQESMQPSDVSSRERALPTDRHPKQNNEPGSSDGVLETRTREELRNGRSEQQDNIEDSCKESSTEAMDAENDGDSLDVESDPMGRCDQPPLKVDTLEGSTIENKCTHHNTTAQPRAMCYPAKAVTMSELRTTKECGEEETKDHPESSFSPSSSRPAFNGMGTSTSSTSSTSSSRSSSCSSSTSLAFDPQWSMLRGPLCGAWRPAMWKNRAYCTSIVLKSIIISISISSSSSSIISSIHSRI